MDKKEEILNRCHWNTVVEHSTSSIHAKTFPLAYKDQALAAMTEYAAEKDEEIKRLREALGSIAKWELPVTDRFWDTDEKERMSYEACYGSHGVREFIISIAKAALSNQKGGEG